MRFGKYQKQENGEWRHPDYDGIMGANLAPALDEAAEAVEMLAGVREYFGDNQIVSDDIDAILAKHLDPEPEPQTGTVFTLPHPAPESLMDTADNFEHIGKTLNWLLRLVENMPTGEKG